MKLQVSSKPWILCGDFNVVRQLSEKWGVDSLNAYELEFDNCLNSLEVTDLNFSGCLFTWNNKSEGSRFIARKLDRVLVNEDWLCNFGRTCVDFSSGGISDHSLAFISVGTMVSFGPKPFKFFNYWLENKDFMSWISDCWSQDVQGVPMFKLCRKLKAVKIMLKEKNVGCYGDIKNKVLQARAHLELAQHDVLDSHGNATSLLRERECLHVYASLMRVEEVFLKQKARNQRLQLGDQNNAFFHRSVKGRHAINTITYLYDEHGNRVEDIGRIKEVAVEFYEKLLGSSFLDFTNMHFARLNELISHVISLENATLLSKEVTAEEIKATLFSMKANKAPSPDRFSADFFKASWIVVGEDFVAAIKDFFNIGFLLKEINATILSLIPKKPNPSGMGDYRPISYCNVIYKCITKILSNRILLVLDSLICRNQSAFIPGRNISENVLLAQELVRNYHRKDSKPRCTLKIDLMKAYDSVN
jgi:hypothetical protein